MLLDEIIDGFPCVIAHTQFVHVPKTVPYAVYVDDIACSGSDGAPYMLKEHSVTIGLYEHLDNQEGTASQIESLLDSYVLEWSKQDRTWFNDEQVYQTVYTFLFYEKIQLD